MSQTDQFPLDCKVYVGNLGNNGNKTELESAFGYYGPLRSVWVARNPPGFAFVEFEDPRDANDAVKELDGRHMCGCRVRVELSNGEKRSRSRGHPPSWGRRPRDDVRRRSSPPVRRRYVCLTILYFDLFVNGLVCTVFVFKAQMTNPI
uniref:Serine and arginine rich splicing factor 3a n=1 Tax=Gasterosteus aculeatus aculeatus TaxID=481459 RepID=G3N9B8_GASAC